MAYAFHARPAKQEFRLALSGSCARTRAVNANTLYLSFKPYSLTDKVCKLKRKYGVDFRE